MSIPLKGYGGSFQPDQINGLEAWFDASDAPSLITNGAAHFTAASSQFLSIPAASAGDFQFGDTNFTIAGAFYLDSVSVGSRTIVSKYQLSGGGREFLVYLNTAALTFVLSANGTDITSVNIPGLSAATWYFFVADYDAATDVMRIILNDGTPAANTHAGGTFASATDFRVGAWVNTGFMSGRVDELAIWNRLLTPGEITWLYNGGMGRTYTDIGVFPGGDNLLTDLISWWGMNQASGTRFDAHGSNNLTDNNAVASIDGIITGRSGENDPVGLWIDLSGNGRNVAQLSAASRPILQTTPLRGVLFDGTDDDLHAVYGHPQPITRYVCFSQETWVNQGRVYGGFNFALLQNTATPQLAISAGIITANNSNLPLTTTGIATVIANGVSSSLQINNTVAATGSAGATNPTSLYLGSSPTPDDHGNMLIHEFLDYSGAHTLDQQAQVKDYLADKWGVTL